MISRMLRLFELSTQYCNPHMRTSVQTVQNHSYICVRPCC